MQDQLLHFVAIGIRTEGNIALRVLSLERPTQAKPFDFQTWLYAQLKASLSLRLRLIGPDTNAFRWLHGEGDGVPGVVIDHYNGSCVIKFDTQAWQAHCSMLVDAITSVCKEASLPIRGILLKSKRNQEGEKHQLLWGTVPANVHIKEEHMLLDVDLYSGQKTGLFLDHRESRKRVRNMAQGLRVLNLFSYTGAFSIAAGLGGAEHVTSVDISKPATLAATHNWELNALSPQKHDAIAEDVYAFLERSKNLQHTYGCIISDPPNFAPKESDKPAAMAAYRKLHRECLKRLAPGGFYLAASCSSHINMDAFQQSLYDACEKTGKQLQLLGKWSAPFDHPQRFGFDHSEYLKVVWLRLF